MTDLKKIAADPQRKHYTVEEIIEAIAKWDTTIGFWLPALRKSDKPTMRDLRDFLTDISWHLADALDALAAQSQDRLEYLLNLCRARHGVMSNAQIIAETECVFAAPQPAPPQSAAPIEKALNDVAQKAMDYARNTDFGGEDAERLAALRESKDHAARLYALASAAPQRMTVSREALCKALHIHREVGRPLTFTTDVIEAALRDLGLIRG